MALADYEFWMRHAIELAKRGPLTGPNPQVGAVIIGPSGELEAEGWHLGAGTEHAETMALGLLREKLGLSETAPLPAGHTAVITLEPCNHFGRTPPCSQTLIASGIERVVFGASDVGGESEGGADSLVAAGIEVVAGVMKHDAEELVESWLKLATEGRPWVIIKWAATLDGRIAADDGSSQWITGPEARAAGHLLRSQCDAIVVGTGTALADDPELTARRPDGSYYEQQPLRVVVGNRDLPPQLKLFNDRSETLRLATRDIDQLMTVLAKRGAKRVLIEGGPKLTSEIIRAGYADEFYIYQAPMLLGGSRLALDQIGIANLSEARQLEIRELSRIGSDVFIQAKLKSRR
ncbi:MAG: bifunctional diaminohydroxyphosphoribosylaminopyrimidine [Actinomycetota bacterium]